MTSSFLRGAGLLASAELLSKLINFGSFVLLAIWLTPEEYGLFAVAWLVFVAADAFFDLGGGVSFFREENNVENFGKYRGYTLCTGSFWFIVEVVAAGLFYISGKEEIALLVFLLALSLMPRIPLAAAQGWWRANFHFERSATVLVINAIAGACAAILAASKGLGEVSLAVRFVAGTLVAGVFAMTIQAGLLSYAFCMSTFRRWAKEGFKYSLTSNWGWLFFFYIEQQIILYLMGTSALGIYNYAKKVVDIALQALMSMSRVILLPYLIKRGMDNRTLVKYTAITLMPVIFSVAAGYAILEMPWFTRLVGDEWMGVVSVACIVIWALPAGFTSTVLTNYLVASQGYKQIVLAEVSATILLLGLGGISYVVSLDLLSFSLWMVLISTFKAVAITVLVLTFRVKCKGL